MTLLHRGIELKAWSNRYRSIISDKWCLHGTQEVCWKAYHVFAVSSKGLLHIQPSHRVLHVAIDVVGAATPSSRFWRGAVQSLWDRKGRESSDLRARGTWGWTDEQTCTRRSLMGLQSVLKLLFVLTAAKWTHCEGHVLHRPRKEMNH